VESKTLPATVHSLYSSDLATLVSNIFAHLNSLSKDLWSASVNDIDVPDLVPESEFDRLSTAVGFFMQAAKRKGMTVDKSNSIDSSEILLFVERELNVVQATLVVWFADMHESMELDFIPLLRKTSTELVYLRAPFNFVLSRAFAFSKDTL
jgi:hypothetical protein